MATIDSVGLNMDLNLRYLILKPFTHTHTHAYSNLSPIHTHRQINNLIH